MAKDLFRPQTILIWLEFCILMGCLTAHFLTDNLYLLPGLNSPTRDAAASSQTGYVEMDHQDDPIIQAPQPVILSALLAYSEFDWIVLFAKQLPSPFFHPPEV